jgi:hypothetical protein
LNIQCVIFHLTNDHCKITDVHLAAHDLNFNVASSLHIFLLFLIFVYCCLTSRSRRGGDRMVVGFTYAISAYHS